MESELQTLAKTDRNPIQESRYQELLGHSGIPFELRGGKAYVEGFGAGGNNAGGQIGVFGPGGEVTNAATAARLQKQYGEAVRPAVESLQAGIPEVQQSYQQQREYLQGSKAPLEQRYKNLLSEMARRETKETTTISTNLAREYGRRGVPLSSTAYQQDLGGKQADVSQFYAGQTKDATLAQGEEERSLDNMISQLTGQEVEAVRNVRNAIAQLQAGSGQNALGAALQYSQLGQQQSQFNQNLEMQKAVQRFNEDIAKRELALKETPQSQYATLGEGQTLFNLLTGSPVYTANKTYKPEAGGSGSGVDLSSIIKLLGGSSSSTPRYQFVP